MGRIGHTDPRTERTPNMAPAEVVAWLEEILRERFHDGLLLRQRDDAHFEISMPDSARRIRIPSNFDIFRRSAFDMPCARWTTHDTRWVPPGWPALVAPGVAHLPPVLIGEEENGYTLRYDVLSLAYWMLSRREEVGAAHLDRHDRYSADRSHAGRHAYLEQPIVDEWLEVVRRIMLALWPDIPLRTSEYTLCLSHDVDDPSRYALIGLPRLLRSVGGDLLRRRHLDTLLHVPAIWSGSRKQIDARDPYNTFEWIMTQSEHAGLRSAFYFICGRTDPRHDAHYEADHPAIVNLMRRIDARGHEIGLHPSFNCYRDPAALAREAQRLRDICAQAGIDVTRLGARMHYLRWETPTTLHGLEAAGMHYDTSLGYAQRPGFRCGTCHEYPAFDPVQNRPLKLRIRPLIVMESTVMTSDWPGTSSVAGARIEKLMAACRRVNGRFTLLWHNTMLERADQKKLYQRVLTQHSRVRS